MKKKLLDLSLTILFISLSFGTLLGQTLDPLNPDLEWKQLLNQNQVTIQYAVGKCNSGDKIFLKTSNSNSGLAVINFDISTNQNNLQIPILLSLEPRQEQEMNCSTQSLIPELMMIEVSNPSLFTCSASEIKIDLIP